jgi:DNA-binding transcriptional regulator YhcF (GntR family)
MYLKDKRERKFLEVRKVLLKGIISGDYNGKLPGERQLAEMSGCSYMTLRRAIRSLVDDGYLHKVVRKGTFIIQSDYDSSMLHSIGIFISENYISDKFEKTSLLSMLIDECSKKNIECSIITDLDAIHHSEFDIIIMMYPRSADIDHLENKFPHDRIIAVEERSELKNIPSVYSDSINYSSASVRIAVQKGMSEILFISNELIKNKYTKRADCFKAACDNNTVRYSEIMYNDDVLSLLKIEEVMNTHSEKSMIVCNSQTDIENFKIILKNMNIENNHILCGFNIISEPGMLSIEENYSNIVSEVFNIGFQLIRGIHPVKKIVVSHVKYHESMN